ncbi:hypothetical protein N7466_011056 [Penicillium verhagenii]|uniref:uncharacterized protein n=1 Tax=Penicillium verhagenii TaxID=1562060 RepID=UPI0025454B12|nr:uncharacterized protein N7466_011056 [Penicillium verhagenii]KAJ5917502.1 hypothetical protein N7466_011056 [Penicillium verhagenii]
MVISLGKGYYDLVVKQNAAAHVAECFAFDLTMYRLKDMADPLFSPESGKSYPETLHSALSQMKHQFEKALKETSKSAYYTELLYEWYPWQMRCLYKLLAEHGLCGLTCQ